MTRKYCKTHDFMEVDVKGVGCLDHNTKTHGQPFNKLKFKNFPMFPQFTLNLKKTVIIESFI